MNSAHEFHVSKLNIHYNPETSKLEMTIHLFIDDLEMAMIKSGYPVKSLKTESENEKEHEYIASYVMSKINIFIDQKKIPLTYLGKEEAERFDAVFMYIESPVIASLNNLKIENSMLTEAFYDQKNIISVYNDKKLLDFFILNKKQTHHIIKS